ncbi:MAG: hypothetical protein Q4G49_15580 [Paracoccus sp. (in: a-proteobacteria)]|nr:hypothetical protein [Paracoccus sp. (in: a-proteobacteria)]
MSRPDRPSDRAGTGSYASPPCLAHEIDPSYFDPRAVDPQQARDVAQWRKAERARLLAQRTAMPVHERKDAAEAVARHLDAVLTARTGDPAGTPSPHGGRSRRN